ncbi:boophilin-H2 isoform X1 [Xenopus laevis]|uniref:Boophilin-H2 isoform X1 n=1 Tax=Xenopus laevis TaxID=8355 RepID=A0A8J0VHN6_XENLA|nr:boophilin-H2 isoform X1 [Xenopus laevis]
MDSVPVLLVVLLALLSVSSAQDYDCNEPMESNAKGGKVIRWSYDKMMGKCKPTVQGEQRGTRNSFTSEKQCLMTCSSDYDNIYPPGDAVCDLPVESGPCLALIPMWSYNKERKLCESFLYSGCQGNGNRFENKDNCTSLCINPKKGRTGGADVSGEQASETDAGLVIGIICGVVFGAAFLVTLSLYLVQRKKLKKQHKPVPTVEMT